MSKAWHKALDARRWPLHSLRLEAPGGPNRPPPLVLWVHSMQPGLERLEIDLDRAGHELVQTPFGRMWMEAEGANLDFGSPAVSATHAALLALRPASVSESRVCWAGTAHAA